MAPEPDRAEGTNTGHENGEAMASVGVRLTAQLGAGWGIGGCIRCVYDTMLKALVEGRIHQVVRLKRPSASRHMTLLELDPSAPHLTEEV